MTEQERYIVLGTAGHIDHGKTALVRALTGVDCDTAPEEKQRGITINIGFAHHRLPDGTHLGIVDVPGHHRFVHNMVAGAVGIDLLLLVVAADDGVMPQTTEHLQIARLLGIERGLVALNKIDLVEEELRELALSDVEELIGGTFLQGCPIVPVSAVTGEGLDELNAALVATAQQASRRTRGDQFRMPVDRCFTIKGAGTVVTGTTLAGTVKVEDEVEIAPLGKRARVRSLQVHGDSVPSVGAGHRTAINLAGIEREDAKRGDVLITPGSLQPTYMFDAMVEILEKPYRLLKRGSAVLLHIGTDELVAKLHPLEQETLSAGEQALVQLRLERQIPISVGDRFILRDSASEYTVGGGEVLDAHPTKHRRKRQEAAKKLEELVAADSWAAVAHEIAKSPYGCARSEIELNLNIKPQTLDQLLAQLREADRGLVEHREGSQVFLTLPENCARIIKEVRRKLQARHAANPLVRKGFSANELVKTLVAKDSGILPGVLKYCLEDAVDRGELAAVEGSYALPERSVTLSRRDQEAVAVILKALNDSAAPEQPDGFIGALPVDRNRARQLLAYLVEDGQVVTSGELYFGREAVERARRDVLGFLQHEEGITISQFNKLVGTSRKYGLPLLQFFDKDGMLVREGDLRRLKAGWTEQV